MMLILTEDDMSRLSLACQTELQQLLFAKITGNEESFDGDYLGVDDAFSLEIPPEGESLGSFDHTIADKARDIKRVIDITVGEAQGLVANISKKSLQTLSLFVAGEPVRLDALVGSGKTYESLTDLKRSFIGAVTRRLRTVTRNKTAALFLKSVTAEGEQDAIAVRAISAESLRVVLGISKKT